MHHIFCTCIMLSYLTVIKFVNPSSVGLNKVFEKYHTDNYKVPNALFTIKTKSLLRCCDLCVLSNNCNAVNYDKSNTVCEFIQANGVDAATLLFEAGFRIYYIKGNSTFIHVVPFTINDIEVVVFMESRFFRYIDIYYHLYHV